MSDGTYSGRNPKYSRLMDSREPALRNTETEYTRQIQQQSPDISRDEALRIAAKWSRKDI